MLRIAVVVIALMMSACAPTTPTLQLQENCRAELSAEQLIKQHWLLRPNVWRLRQSALLEIGSRKIPLEGFLRLDIEQREARLLAMNEMGLVLFDLQVTADDQKLHKAIPQLMQIKGLAQGVAQSLRQIFLTPQPLLNDRLENRGNSQQLARSLEEGSLGFVFDCLGDLRETRQRNSFGNWRVVYTQYQLYGTARLPEQIVMNDYRHNTKLSLWLREVKQEP